MESSNFISYLEVGFLGKTSPPDYSILFFELVGPYLGFEWVVMGIIVQVQGDTVIPYPGCLFLLYETYHWKLYIYMLLL